ARPMSGISRRQFVVSAAVAAAASGEAFGQARTIMQPFANGARSLVQLPGKRPLIGLTARPPQLETPFSVFNEGLLTPNDAFFVRYHLAQVPTSIDPEKFTLEVKGRVNSVSKFSLAELKKFNPLELVAVNQCSGNGRGFSTPR